jgi:competence protein ComEC
MLDYEEKNQAPEFKIGNRLNFYGEISDFSNDSLDFNANSYYLSKGYSAKIIKPTEFEVSGEEKLTLASYFNSKRNDIAEFLIKNSNEKAGGLLAALLLGEKEFLSPQIELDFRRIGISHILALSGLHLAVLALGFAKLLSLFCIGKKLRTLFTLIFTVLYMSLTGFPISVVRAGIMLIIASLLFLLANATDSLTNLTIAVFLIVLSSPYAIFDISLLLSAFATLGIVSLAELPKEYHAKIGLKNLVLNSLTVSLFAISATFLISVLSFGEISVISPISTLVFSLIIEIFLYFGTFFLVFGKRTDRD